MDVMTALAAVSHAIDGVRKLREIERDFDAAAYRLQIADLTSSLADAKLALTDVQQEIGAQKSEIARLKEALRFQGKTITVRGQVYESGPNGDPIGMPFCPVCIVDDAVYVRLADDLKGLRGDAFCPRCKSKHSRIMAKAYPESATGG